MSWTPTPEEIEAAGDALLEALIRTSNPMAIPERGDLVLEWTAGALEWERVGYLLSEPDARPVVVWSVGRRVVRWHNAAVRRLGSPGTRLQSLPFPTAEDLDGQGVRDS